MARLLSIAQHQSSHLPSIRHSLCCFLHCCPNIISFVHALSCRTPSYAELSAWVLLAERPISLVVDEAVLPGSTGSLEYHKPYAFELRLSRGARRGNGGSTICKVSLDQHRIKNIPRSPKTRAWRASALCSDTSSATAKQCQTTFRRRQDI